MSLRCPTPTCLHPLTTSGVPLFTCPHCGAQWTIEIINPPQRNDEVKDVDVPNMLARVLSEAALDALHTWLDQNYFHAAELAKAIVAHRPELMLALGFVQDFASKPEDPEPWSDEPFPTSDAEEIWRNSTDPDFPHDMRSAYGPE